MATPGKLASELVDDDLGARPECESNIRDQDSKAIGCVRDI
jgi:hypothetical protein